MFGFGDSPPAKPPRPDANAAESRPQQGGGPVDQQDHGRALALLATLGLVQYTPAFSRGAVTFSTLAHADDAYLAGVGVTSKLHRLRILDAVQKAGGAPKDTPMRQAAVEQRQQQLLQQRGETSPFAKTATLDRKMAAVDEEWAQLEAEFAAAAVTAPGRKAAGGDRGSTLLEQAETEEAVYLSRQVIRIEQERLAKERDQKAQQLQMSTAAAAKLKTRQESDPSMFGAAKTKKSKIFEALNPKPLWHQTARDRYVHWLRCCTLVTLTQQ